MKIIILSILLISCITSKQKKHTQKLKKETPQGKTLQNIFSMNPYSNPYGPQPRLQLQSGIQISSMGDIEEVKPENIINCDNTHHNLLKMCISIQECDLCSTSIHCGWCVLRGECLPKESKEQQICGQSVCGTGMMIENINQCGTYMVSGPIDKDVDSGSKGVYKPELTAKKYRVNTIYQHPVVVTTPVLLGFKHEEQQKQMRDIFTNKVVRNRLFKSVKPVYGEIRQVKNVNTFHQQILDEHMNKIMPDDKFVNHGIDLD